MAYRILPCSSNSVGPGIMPWIMNAPIKIAVAPSPGTPSAAGRIVSGWRYDGDVVTYEFEIPANLTADVTLPDGRKFTLAPGKHTV